MPRVNKEARLAYQRGYYARNRDYLCQRRAELRNEDLLSYNTGQRKRYHSNLEGKAKHNLRMRELNQKQKLLVLSHYSEGTLKCAHCGIKDIDVLTLDHINGGGTQHRLQYGSKAYREAINEGFPEDFQVLCFNCNWKKHLQTLDNQPLGIGL